MMKSVKNKLCRWDNEIWDSLDNFIEQNPKLDVFHKLDIDMDKINQIWTLINQTFDA